MHCTRLTCTIVYGLLCQTTGCRVLSWATAGERFDTELPISQHLCQQEEPHGHAPRMARAEIYFHSKL
jgi:hypothetical protein